MTAPLGPREGALFARLADELIPASPDIAAPSALDIAGRGLRRLLDVHPALGRRAVDALARVSASGLCAAEDVRAKAPADFAVLCEAVAGIHLTDPSVAAAYGYTGRVPVDVGDAHARIAEYRALVDPVVARGWIWRGDGSDVPD